MRLLSRWRRVLAALVVMLLVAFLGIAIASSVNAFVDTTRATLGQQLYASDIASGVAAVAFLVLAVVFYFVVATFSRYQSGDDPDLGRHIARLVGIRFVIASFIVVGLTGIWAYIIYGFTGNTVFSVAGAVGLAVVTKGFTRPSLGTAYNHLRHPVAARSTSVVQLV